MIKYIKISDKNVIYATKIQMEIFPNESAYQEFIDCIKDGKEYNQYYLVYDDKKVIGITRLQTTTNIEKTNTIWMGWYGILKKYRNKGYGNTVLLDTIEMAKRLSKQYNIKYFRVFT